MPTENNNRSAADCQMINCLQCASVFAASCERCTHCNAHLHSRKENSIMRTWIYLLTSIILFFPANLLPITHTSFFGGNVSSDTIIGNIIFLYHSGSVFVALVIFAASVVTPIFKMIVLLYLLTNRHPKNAPLWQTRIYRFICWLGRWSMIDVFVVALLCALIQGRLASIAPAIGIFAFAGVVIFSMLAAEAFDIRLTWDNYRRYRNAIAAENSTHEKSKNYATSSNR